MSTVNVSLGRATNSSHDHERGSSTAPLIVKLHWSRDVWGVGPAERTGKSSTTYWPGGTRDASTSARRRPRKPRETGAISLRSAGADRSPRSLLVALDRRLGSGRRSIWVFSRVSPASTLTQQIPALIQLY